MTDDNASGRKYFRQIKGGKVFLTGPDAAQQIDVYGVIETFGVTCPARQHALKKILLAGDRGKNDTIDDLKEARDAIKEQDLTQARQEVRE
jgi:hypothetical protein